MDLSFLPDKPIEPIVPARKKGPGFLGTLQRPDGKVSTELSIGVNLAGKETEIPTLIPTLTQNERDHLLSGGEPTKEIVDKAVAHAHQRIAQGKSPFAQAGKETQSAKVGAVPGLGMPPAETIPSHEPSIKAAPDLSFLPDQPKKGLGERIKAGLGSVAKTVSGITKTEAPGETIRNLGTVWGPAEAAANLVSQVYGLPAMGIAELIKTVGGPEWLPETTAKGLIYQPQTKAGQQVTEATAYPFAKLQELSEHIADYVREKTGSPLAATAAGTITELLGLGLTGKTLGKFHLNKIAKEQGAKPMTPKDWGELAKPLEPAPELQRPALPPGQGFTLKEAPKETIRRPAKEPEIYVKTEAGYQPAFFDEATGQWSTPLKPAEAKGLPEGQGFTVKEPPPGTILRPPKEQPKGKAVEISPEGEPTYRPGQKPVLDLSFLPDQPKTEVKPEVKAEARPEKIVAPVKEEAKPIPRLDEIEREENSLLAKSHETELTPEEVSHLKSLRFEAITERKKTGVETKAPSVSEIKDLTEEKPTPSPTQKEGQLLPGMKVGLEFPKEGKEAKPTLEGTPLMESAIKAEREKAQPKLGLGAKREVLDPDIEGQIRDLREIVRSGEAGKRYPLETGEWTGSGSTMQLGKIVGEDIKVGKLEVLSAIDKGLKGEKLGPKQQEIFERVKKTATDIITERKESEFALARDKIKGADPDWLKAETFDSLTKNYDDEIIGIKEDLREQGYSDTQINEIVPKISKAYEGTGRPPSFEEIQGFFRETPAKPEPAPKGTSLTELKSAPKSEEIPQALTFRKFVESKGVEWKSFNATHPEYSNLKAAWDMVRSEKGQLHIPTRQELSEAYERILPARVRENIYQNAVNRFAAIENIEKKARKLGAKIEPGESPKFRSREYLGIAQKVQSVLEDKTYRIKPDGKIEITGEGLKPVLDEYQKLSPEKNIEVKTQEFNDYFISKRIVEDLQRPKAPWTTEEIVTPEQVAGAQAKLDALKQKYGNLDHFEAISQRFYDYKNRVLHTLVDSGNMSQAKYDQILAKNPHHVSFRRVLDEYEPTVHGGPKVQKPFTEAKSPIKRIKGSELEIEDAIESTILDTYRIMDIAERNTVARTVAKLKDVLPEEIVGKDIQIVPLTKVTHHAVIDEKFRQELEKFAGGMGATFKTGKEVKPGRALGTYTPGAEQVMHRQATKSDTFAHEVGHFFDDKFGLKQKFYKRGASKEVAEELIAHMQDIGEPPYRIKKPEERFARGFEWWLTHRDLAQRDLPKFSEAMEKIVSDTPELKPLLDIRPSPHKTFESQEVTIFGPSPFKPKGNVIEYFEEGKRKYIEVPENLYRAMSGLNETSSDLLTKILSVPATGLRTGVTSTPEFVLRNFIRDNFDAFIQSNVGFRPGIDPVAALADVIGKSDAYYDWLRTGGGHSTFVDLSRRNLEHISNQLKGDSSSLRYLNIIGDAQEISQAIEQATRLGVYKAAIRKGKTPTEAAFDAREATVDFGVKGESRGLRTFSSITAFFNPAIQGTARWVRAHRQNPMATTLKSLAAVTMPSIFLWALNKDDEDYKEVPQWQKDLFWLIKVGEREDPITFVRIPKPFLFGQVYGSAVERFLTYLDTKDPKAMKDFFRSLVDASTPVQGDPNGVLLPTGVKPLIENATNWQFFKEAPVVPESRKGLLPEYQYGKYTTESAKIIGKYLGWSPAKIENFVRGVTGGTGQYSLEAIDLALKAIEGEKEGKRPREWADVPLVKGFVTRPVESDPQSLRDFYENSRSLDQAYKSFRDSLKNLNSEDAKEIIKNHPKLIVSPSMEQVRENIALLNKQIDLISKSKDIPDFEKRKKIRQVEAMRLKLAQMGNQIMEKTKSK